MGIYSEVKEIKPERLYNPALTMLLQTALVEVVNDFLAEHPDSLKSEVVTALEMVYFGYKCEAYGKFPK